MMSPPLSSQTPESEKAAEPSPPIGPRSLPAEIQLEVLRQMLICSDELAFTHLPLSKEEREEQDKKYSPRAYRPKWFSDTLRLARWNHCKHDEPVAKALKADFSALCLVSRDVRHIARGIFFRENRWVLHVTGSFNAIGWIVRYWGQEALSLMTNVRIELQARIELGHKALGILVQAAKEGKMLQNLSVELQARIELGHKALGILVQAAKEGKMLQNLSVEWVQRIPPLQCARNTSTGWHFRPLLRDRGLERNREGGRGLIIPPEEEEEYDEDCRGTKYLGRQSEPYEWAEEEVLLLPLAELRGLAKVRVEGTVTESWAIWLERTMTARIGETVPEFIFQLRAKQAIQRLKDEEIVE